MVLDRHQKIGLQFSGGKDSLACLQLLRDELERITVYHLRTPDYDPCVDEAVAWARSIAKHFVTIESAQPANTVPSDVVPSNATPLGLYVKGATQPVIIDRFACCFATIMLPLHQRMLDDGVTLIIRGQKNADRRKSAVRSGDVSEGIEYLFPLEAWDDNEVFALLTTHDVPIPTCYDELDTLPDCLTCSAWWDEHRTGYLRHRHPEKFAIVAERLAYIGTMIRDELQHLEVANG